MSERQEKQKREYLEMRRTATGLFVFVALLYLLSLKLEELSPWFEVLEAFSEAAMVGALADWFAVTALFRHPLGLPIPHTAVIPRRRDVLAADIGEFIQQNFFSTKAVAKKLKTIDVGRKAAVWAENPEHASLVADYLISLLRSALALVDDERMTRLLSERLRPRLAMRVHALVVDHVLPSLIRSRKDQLLFDELLEFFSIMFSDNRQNIKDRILQEGYWFVPKGIQEHIAEKVAGAASSMLSEIERDPEHEARRSFHRAAEDYVRRIRNQPELRRRGENLVAELVRHPEISASLDNLWEALREELMKELARRGGESEEDIGEGEGEGEDPVRSQLREAVELLASSLKERPETLERLDRFIRYLAVSFVGTYGHDISEYVAAEVRRWDIASVNEKIELQVGRDLQYIRINGTLIGGAVGLIIYALSLLFARLF